MDLTAAEKEEIKKLIDAGRPLPAEYRFRLFADAAETELIWKGKSAEVTSAVLPFQSIEQIDEPRAKQAFRYYFAQREAVESTIWLYEVEQARDPHSLLRYDAAGALSQREFDEDWTRYVLKLATGTGKTKVMSLLIAWAYFHRKYEPGSDLSTNFLVIAPNIIVLDRLRVDFDGLQIFHADPVLPEDGYEGRHWSTDFQMTLHIQDEIGPLSDTGNLFLSNIHRVFLNDAEPSIDDEDATDFLLGKRPKGKAIDSGMDLGEIIRKVPDLVILNDEAHHIHDKGLAWFKSIQDIASGLRLRDSRLSAQFDLTATPPSPSRSGATSISRTSIRTPSATRPPWTGATTRPSRT